MRLNRRRQRGACQQEFRFDRPSVAARRISFSPVEFDSRITILLKRWSDRSIERSQNDRIQKSAKTSQNVSKTKYWWTATILPYVRRTVRRTVDGRPRKEKPPSHGASLSFLRMMQTKPQSGKSATPCAIVDKKSKVQTLLPFATSCYYFQQMIKDAGDVRTDVQRFAQRKRAS